MFLCIHHGLTTYVSCLAGAWMTTSERWCEVKPTWARMADRWVTLQSSLESRISRKILKGNTFCNKLLSAWCSKQMQLSLLPSLQQRVFLHVWIEVCCRRVKSLGEHLYRVLNALNTTRSFIQAKNRAISCSQTPKIHVFPPHCRFPVFPYCFHGKGQDDSDTFPLFKLHPSVENTSGK